MEYKSVTLSEAFDSVQSSLKRARNPKTISALKQFMLDLQAYQTYTARLKLLGINEEYIITLFDRSIKLVKAQPNASGVYVIQPFVRGVEYNDFNDTAPFSSYMGTSLKVINTKNRIKNLSHLFAYLPQVEHLDLSDFDTTGCTSTESMFEASEHLVSLNLTSFDTSLVESMYEMFSGCKRLQYIDVSSFNTHKVTNMTLMFSNCWALQQLDLSNFNTRKVIQMSYMFNVCSTLRVLDLRSFDTRELRHCSCMFNNCNNLTKILWHFNTHNLQSASRLFAYCIKLETVDMSTWTAENLEDVSRMFYNCIKLTEVNLSFWKAHAAKNFSEMFSDCVNLRKVNLANVCSYLGRFNYTDYKCMFANCSNLQEVNLGRLLLKSDSKCYSNMFNGCKSLTVVYAVYNKTVQVLQQIIRRKNCKIVELGDNYGESKTTID